ncbi:unnamed protein product, partial [Rotaria sp. Silwood1]
MLMEDDFVELQSAFMAEKRAIQGEDD